MIVGEKVFIRPLEREDLSFVLELFNDTETSLLEGRWEFPLTMEHQQRWFEENFDDDLNKRFVIWDLNKQERVGYTSLTEINWQSRFGHTAVKLHKAGGGKGYAYDAIMTLMGYAFFQMNLNKLKSEIIQFNRASYHIYVRKCGWRVEGIFRQHVYLNDHYHDLYSVSILKSEFLNIVKGTPYEVKDLASEYGELQVDEKEVVVIPLK